MHRSLYLAEEGTDDHPAIFFSGWLPDFLTAKNDILPQFGCDGPMNAFGVCDRTLERLMREAARPQASKCAKGDWRLIEEAMLAPLTNGLVAYPVSDRVGNVQIHPLWSLLLTRLWVQLTALRTVVAVVLASPFRGSERKTSARPARERRRR